jgi:hypothetical protein
VDTVIPGLLLWGTIKDKAYTQKSTNVNQHDGYMENMFTDPDEDTQLWRGARMLKKDFKSVCVWTF